MTKSPAQQPSLRSKDHHREGHATMVTSTVRSSANRPKSGCIQRDRAIPADVKTAIHQPFLRNVGYVPRIGSLMVLLFLIPLQSISEARSSHAQPPKPAQKPSLAARAGANSCKLIELTGDVSAGQQWSAPIGQGWVFTLVPIAPSNKGYTGWDLVVDRPSQGSFPDALLLATPPYGSLNEREIGTTFGLRAQDAIAWQPRHFRFFTSSKTLARGRQLFASLMSAGATQHQRNQAGADLLAMVASRAGTASGEFTVLDTKLTAGTANPPAFAQQWATHLARIPHTLTQSSAPATARGELHWIQFRATLQMPVGWIVSSDVPFTASRCTE